MNSSLLLSQDFLYTTLGKIHGSNYKGIFNSNLNIRYLFYEYSKNHEIVPTIIELIKKFPNKRWDFEFILKQNTIFPHYLLDIPEISKKIKPLMIVSNPNVSFEEAFEILKSNNMGEYLIAANPNTKIEYIINDLINSIIDGTMLVSWDFRIFREIISKRLPLEIIDEYLDKIGFDWSIIGARKDLTFDFYMKYAGGDSENYKHKIKNWNARNSRFTIDEYKIIVEETIRQDHHNNQEVSKSRNIDFEYAKNNIYKNKYHDKNIYKITNKFENRLSWKFYSANPNLTPEIIEDNLNIPFNVYRLSSNHNITPEFIEKYPNEFWENENNIEPNYGYDSEEDSEEEITYYKWYYPELSKILPLNYILKHKDLKWSFPRISSNPTITYEFIEKYEGKLDFRTISHNLSLY